MSGPRPAMNAARGMVRSLRYSRAFVALGRIVAGEEGVLTTALPLVLDAMQVDWGAAYRTEAGGLTLAASHGIAISLRAAVETLDIDRVPDFAGCRAVRTRRAILDDRVFQPVIDASTASLFELAGVERGIAVPMLYRRAPMGVLVLAQPPHEAVDSDLLAFLDAVACLLACPLLMSELVPEPGTDRRRSSRPPARMDEPARPSVDMTRVARDATKQLARTFERAACELDLSLDVWCGVHGNRDRLFVAVCHLLTNALEAVHTRDERRDLPPVPRRARLTVERGADTVSILVEDSGPGIAPELRSRVFDAGYTTKGPWRGEGLHTARQVALEHAGSIEVGVSEELGGASFRFVLPATSMV